MQFTSLHFAIFFPIVIGLYLTIPKKFRSFFLLAASYYFYMSWNPKYALLIGFSTIVTYLCGLCIDQTGQLEGSRTKKGKNAVLAAGILINLGILFVFKYGNFALGTLDAVLQRLHIGGIDGRFNLLLPVGISFYTFQALGYMIDVYRGDVRAEKNFINYALFVSFFPQLVAGPIERSKNLLGQIREIQNIKLWNAKRVTSGAILMVWGFFMKMVIADRIAVLVDTVFSNYRMYGNVELLLAAAGFSLQIYCDFGSYSLIAIGAARIMGFTLMENFNTPYFAKNIRDFWGRWHISLSTWFRDYLYIPLGGNRKGSRRKAVNLMIVFLTSGLWHGANWTFVVWGGIHGLCQIISDVSASWRSKLCRGMHIKTDCMSFKLLQILATYALVVFAWIFFRSDSVPDAWNYISRIATRFDPWVMFDGGIYTLGLDRAEMNILLFSLVLLLLVDLVRYWRKQTIDAFLMEQNLWFEWLVVIVLLVMIFVFGEYGPAFDAQQFIYFQF
jgi:D-alanyl-lipoteichoic acid acyltransferase DltB (MBOAT superfamily)